MLGIIPWRQKKQNDVTEFRKDVDTLFDRFFGGNFFPAAEFMREGVWSPRVDVIDGKKGLLQEPLIFRLKLTPMPSMHLIRKGY